MKLGTWNTKVIASTLLFFIPMRLHKSLKIIFLVVVLCVSVARAQQTNPVDRKVSNPITDTPNVDPVSGEKVTTDNTDWIRILSVSSAA